jgi:glycosyltransferase involved in cell wall biosynthesis
MLRSRGGQRVATPLMCYSCRKVRGDWMAKYLVLDPDFALSGHHIDYLSMLESYARKNGDVEIHFVIPAESSFPAGDESENFKRRRLPAIDKRGARWRSRMLNAAVSYAQANSIDCITLMPADGFQLAILERAFRREKQNFVLLLLAPEALSFDFRSRLVASRKVIQNLLACANTRAGMLVLNNEPFASRTNRFCVPRRHAAVSVGDPIVDGDFVPTETKRQPDSSRATTILALGSQLERKNIVRAVQAVAFLADRLVERAFELRVVGRFPDQDLQRAVEAELQLLSVRPNAHAIINPTFVDDETRRQHLNDADVLFAAYDGFAGSSGIVSHAGSFGRPIVVSKGGVMATTVRKYRIGSVVDPHSIADIARGIEDCMDLALAPEDLAQFRLDMSPDIFVRGLLGRQGA